MGTAAAAAERAAYLAKETSCLHNILCGGAQYTNWGPALAIWTVYIVHATKQLPTATSNRLCLCSQTQGVLLSPSRAYHLPLWSTEVALGSSVTSCMSVDSRGLSHLNRYCQELFGIVVLSPIVDRLS